MTDASIPPPPPLPPVTAPPPVFPAPAYPSTNVAWLLQQQAQKLIDLNTTLQRASRRLAKLDLTEAPYSYDADVITNITNFLETATSALNSIDWDAVETLAQVY